jgi:hypothetical protein
VAIILVQEFISSRVLSRRKKLKNVYAAPMKTGHSLNKATVLAVNDRARGT